MGIFCFRKNGTGGQAAHASARRPRSSPAAGPSATLRPVPRLMPKPLHGIALLALLRHARAEIGILHVEAAQDEVLREVGVLHVGELCHARCFGDASDMRGPQRTGHCTSGFCGASGACCRVGLTDGPCDGTMGCSEHQCCVSATSKARPVARANTPSPPPLPPLSECAIERITYEVGHSQHDAMGDKMIEILIHVEPWRPDSTVRLVYQQHDLSGACVLCPIAL